jgi:hypothetical protein
LRKFVRTYHDLNDSKSEIKEIVRTVVHEAIKLPDWDNLSRNSSTTDTFHQYFLSAATIHQSYKKLGL